MQIRSSVADLHVFFLISSLDVRPARGDLSGAATIPTAPGVQVQPGIVLCTAMEILSLERGNYAYPISMI